MSRLFTQVNPSDKTLEQEILHVLSTVCFHSSNYEEMEKLASYFRGGVIKFYDKDLLDIVYTTLIGPARMYGYYYLSEEDENEVRMIRTSSESQYNGDDGRFSFACASVLRAIEVERASRVASLSSTPL